MPTFSGQTLHLKAPNRAIAGWYTRHGFQPARHYRLGRPGVQMPVSPSTETFAILAERGRGKSYTSAVMAEELLGAGVPVVLDPNDPRVMHLELAKES